MRRTSRNSGFWLCLIINLFLNAEAAIPAVILFVLHFFTELSLWWTALALGLWIIYALVITLFFSWVSKCGSEPPPPKKNKNPYSNNSKIK